MTPSSNPSIRTTLAFLAGVGGAIAEVVATTAIGTVGRGLPIAGGGAISEGLDVEASNALVFFRKEASCAEVTWDQAWTSASSRQARLRNC